MRPLSRLVRPPSPLAKPCSIGATDVPDLEQFLRLIGQRYVLYYPSLARVTGSANAALMLGHMLYWSRKFLTKHPERSGWMWCTAADWTLATGLSRHEQDTARAVLRNTGCVEERLIGVPAKMHYRVDLERLGQLVADFLQRQYIGWVWEESVVRGLLGAPVAYQRLFAEITGSSSAALYLSDLCQMRKYFNGCSSRADVDGTWMELPLGSSATRLARSTKTLRTARNVLLALRLIEERSTRGVQPRIQTRICLQQIMRLAAEKLKNSANSKGVDLQVIDFAGMAETSIPDVPKPANWMCRNRQTSLPETSHLLIGLVLQRVSFQNNNNYRAFPPCVVVVVVMKEMAKGPPLNKLRNGKRDRLLRSQRRLNSSSRLRSSMNSRFLSLWPPTSESRPAHWWRICRMRGARK